MEAIRQQLINEYQHLQQLEVEFKYQINILKSLIKRPQHYKDQVKKQNQVLKHLMESWCLPEITPINQPKLRKTPQQKSNCSEQHYINYLYDSKVVVSKVLSLQYDDHMARHTQWKWMTTQEQQQYINNIAPKEIKVPYRGWVLDVFKNSHQKVRCCWRLVELEKKSKYRISVHYLGWDHKYDTILDCQSPIDNRRWVKERALLTPYQTKKSLKYRHNSELNEIGQSYGSMDFNQLALKK